MHADMRMYTHAQAQAHTVPSSAPQHQTCARCALYARASVRGYNTCLSFPPTPLSRAFTC
ncbi:hypothetical protein EON66_07125 [archaeon]|nr:MAG: hypothetical protein EON66_07125 [archaeon]